VASRAQAPGRSGEIVRRSSYGPTSPSVGERGARTREQIVDAALQLFAAQGFHETLVDDIAGAADVSRATLYQYFESKDELFVELAEEAGAALRRMVKRIGPLGASVEGFDNLHWWLGEWLWVYEKYATVLIQWATIDAQASPTSALTAKFTQGYLSQLVRRFSQVDLGGLDAEDAAAAVLALLERFNYLRHTRGLTQSAEALTDELAVIVQLYLFPHTSTGIFAEHRLGDSDR